MTYIPQYALASCPDKEEWVELMRMGKVREVWEAPWERKVWL